MQPPVEFQDKSQYTERMNALLTLDPSRTVVLTVDMQRDYLDMEIGAAPVAPDEAERVLKHARDLLDFARSEGLPVVHVYVNRRPVELAGGLATAGETFRLGREHRLSQNARRGVRTVPDRAAGSPHAEVPAILVAPEDVHASSGPTWSSCSSASIAPTRSSSPASTPTRAFTRPPSRRRTGATRPSSSRTAWRACGGRTTTGWPSS